MDKGLFDTLLYLIPIAFFIAIRIINSKNVKNRNSRAEEQKKPAKKQQAKKQPEKSSYRSPFPDAGSAAEDSFPVQSVAAEKTKKDTAARSSVLQARVVRKELTPLQQGVVWAEILGPPKGDW